MAKKSNGPAVVDKIEIKRPNVHAKTKSSTLKSSKNYTKKASQAPRDSTAQWKLKPPSRRRRCQPIALRVS